MNFRKNFHLKLMFSNYFVLPGYDSHAIEKWFFIWFCYTNCIFESEKWFDRRYFQIVIIILFFLQERYVYLIRVEHSYGLAVVSSASFYMIKRWSYFLFYLINLTTSTDRQLKITLNDVWQIEIILNHIYVRSRSCRPDFPTFQHGLRVNPRRRTVWTLEKSWAARPGPRPEFRSYTIKEK